MDYLLYCVFAFCLFGEPRDVLDDVVHATLGEKTLFAPNTKFQAAMTEVDRIVILDGGYDCCNEKDDKQLPILVEITAPDEVEMFKKNMCFPNDPIESADMCLCCGWPRISWYKGDTRIALTSVQHGIGLRWSKFSTITCLAIWRVGYGDMVFTAETKVWFADWCKAHDIRSDIN